MCGGVDSSRLPHLPLIVCKLKMLNKLNEEKKTQSSINAKKKKFNLKTHCYAEQFPLRLTFLCRLSVGKTKGKEGMEVMLKPLKAQRKVYLAICSSQ